MGEKETAGAAERSSVQDFEKNTEGERVMFNPREYSRESVGAAPAGDPSPAAAEGKATIRNTNS